MEDYEISRLPNLKKKVVRDLKPHVKEIFDRRMALL